MRFIEDLCPPALLYLLFVAIQLGLDLSLGLYVTFAIKAILGLAVVLVLDVLCGMGLGGVSWFLVAAPFIITALATAIAMGTSFDSKVIAVLAKETFVDKEAKEGDLPADSNQVA
jgi:hypothetical protein